MVVADDCKYTPCKGSSQDRSPGRYAGLLAVMLAGSVIVMGLVGCAASQTQTSGESRQAVEAYARELPSLYRNSPEAQALRGVLENQAVTRGSDTLRFLVDLRWDDTVPMPEAGYPVYLSLHAGGAFTTAENDEQWQIQQGRYPAVRGLLVCPRAARDTWDQWHHEHLVEMIDTLVRALVLRGDVDANRIYLTGYCSGGNGVYQLAPILADRWAAASATKGISEGAPLDNLRNCPIDLQWGQADPDPIARPAHNRANVDALYALHAGDRAGYTFREIEHWRQGRFVNDKSTIAWLSRFERNPYPARIIWVQNGPARTTSNPVRHQFYWLAVDESYARDGSGPDRIDAIFNRTTNTVALEVVGYEHVRVRLNDTMLDLDTPVKIVVNGKVAFQGRVERSLETMARTMSECGDVNYAFPVEVRVEVK